MPDYNYITDRKHTGGMISSGGFAFQDLVAVKYIFENMDKGLSQIACEGENDFALYYSDENTQKCQCKSTILTMRSVASLCEQYNDDSKQTIIGSGMDDGFRKFYQKLVRYRNACFGGINQQDLDRDIKELCDKEKIDVTKVLNFDFDVVESNNAYDLAKLAIIEYGNRNHLYINAEELIIYLCGIISIKLRPHAGHLSFNQINELIMKSRLDKSIGVFESDPLFGDYVKTKIITDISNMESRHKRFRDQLAIIRNSIEQNQYVKAKNEVLDIVGEEEWIIPIYCWLLNRLNDTKEMDVFASNYNGNDPQVLFEIAKYLCYKCEYNKALNILKGLLKESETSETLMLTAYIYSKLNNKEDAIKYAKQCIASDDAFDVAYILIASLIKEDDAEEAVSLLMKAKELDAKNPQIYYELSVISDSCDDFELSAKYLKEYIRLSKNEDIGLLIKIPVYLNYINNENWEDEYHDMIRKIQSKSEIKDIIIPVFVWPKGKDITVYVFHCKDSMLFLAKDGQIITGVTDLNYHFSIGTYSSPTNVFFSKFINSSMFSNPARFADESIDASSVSPTLFCYPRSYEVYEKTIKGLLETKAFAQNHDYSETSAEYVDRKRAICLEIEKRDSNAYGLLNIADQLKCSFTISSASNGFKGFCNAIDRSPFDEAFFIVSFGKNHQNIFTFNTDQIKIKL